MLRQKLYLLLRYSMSFVLGVGMASVPASTATPAVARVNRQAEVTRICTVNAAGGATYTTIQAAVDDESCTTINVAAGTYAEHDITIARNVEIGGSGRNTTEVNAQRLGRVFNIAAGAQVTIRDLTIANASGPGTSVGGGVNNAGILTLSNCIVKDSIISSSGAGIANTGQLSMDRCIVRNNNGYGGGGIYNDGIMTITASAIVSNTGFFAPGIAMGTTSNAASSLTIINSTLAANSGGDTTAQLETYAGATSVTNSTLVSYRNTSRAMINAGGSITVRNTLISVPPNTTTTGSTLCTGNITNGGGNLSSDNSCGIANVADPKLDLAGLKDNGGNTLTFALLPVSPAIDAAIAANCPATDQRGIARPQGAGCDVGAFERTAGDPISPTATPTPAAGVCTVSAAGGATHTTIQAAVNDLSCVVINVAAGTHAEHDITIARNVEIIGSGRDTTEVNAQQLGRVFNILAGGRVAIRNLTIANGKGPDNPIGGGVRNDGILTLSDCIVRDNTSNSAGAGVGSNGHLSMDRCIVRNNSGFGAGGIYNAGIMTITASAIVSNTGQYAAGIAMGIVGNGPSSLTIINSTIAANRGGDSPLQIQMAAQLQTYEDATTALVINSTIVSSRNTSRAIINSRGSITLRNTLISVPSITSATGSIACQGNITDGGGNLSPDTSCGIANIADPKLDPEGLKDNGGDTFTIALQPDSPAINAAIAANCPAADQRSITRPQGAGCDIGAYELNDVTATPTPTPTGNNLALQIKIYDQTRAPLNNWEVQVFDMADGENMVAQGNTNATGSVTFNIPQGLYKICQTLQGGWQNTYPGGSCYWQTLTGVSSKSLSFANRLTGATSTPTPVVTATPSGVCVPLSRAGWVARSSYGGNVALAIDGSPATFWNNGILQQGQGQWFSVDLGSVRDISQLTLDIGADPTNYARKLDVFTSVGGGTFALVGSALPTTPNTIVRFPSRKARYVTVQIAASNFTASWSIGDFDLCNGGAATTSNFAAAEIWKLDISTQVMRVFLPSVAR